MYKIYEIYEIYKYMRYMRCTKGIKKYETDKKYPSQYGFHNRAGSRQLAVDLSLLRRECWEACISSLTINTLNLLKTIPHFIPTSLFSDTFNL